VALWRGHSLSNLGQIGACTLALLLGLLNTVLPLCHAHRDSSDALYDDECPDLRLAMSADSAGPGFRPLAENGVPLDVGELLDGLAPSFIPDVRLAQTDARAPPLPA
jgi:hypothetical protein